MRKTDIHIILDYGHAKKTKGKSSPLYKTLSAKDQEFFAKHKEFGTDRYYEYLSNRVIGRKIAEELRKHGWLVDEIVPENITDVSLSERVRRTNTLCKRHGASNCIFISIHSNASGAGKWMKAVGWSAYTTKGKTNSDKLATCMYKFADKYFPKDGMKVRKDMSDGDPDWEENFTVIKGANCTAVLTESFFYDTLTDLKYLVSDKGQEAIVKTHVEGIEEYMRLYKGIQ